MNRKLEVKDLINIGIFSAVYIVVMMAVVTFLGMIPILYVMAPLFVAFICGTIYMLFVMKTPKAGAILIMSLLMSLLFLGAAIYASLWVIFIGLLAEALLWNKGHKSIGKIKASYALYSLTTVGPYFGILIMKSNYLMKTAEYYGQAYADGLDKLTPPWLLAPLMVGTMIMGFIGASIGAKILEKHFKKAGVV